MIYLIDIFNFSKVIKNIGIFLILLFVVSLVLWLANKEYLSIDTPVRMILPSSLTSTLLGDATNMYIYTTDWMFNKALLRFVGIFNYPAETALSMIFIIIFTFYYYKYSKNMKKFVLVGILLFTVFIMSLSRITWIGIIISIFIINIMLKISQNRKDSLSKIIKINLFIILLVLIYFTKIDMMGNIYSSREGSNEARISIYVKALELGKENIALGTGMKHSNDIGNIPIGSHSTYIGVFMKTGIVGFLILIAFLVSIFIRLLRNKNINNDCIWNICGIFFISSLVWMVTEDVDAPNIASFFFFLNCSFITRIDKLGNLEDNQNE